MANINYRKILGLTFLMAATFFAGRLAARIVDHTKQTIFHSEAVTASADGNWGLSFQEEGQPPVANASMEELKQFDAYYAEDTTEKSAVHNV